MRSLLSSVVFVVLFLGSVAAQQPVQGARHPALSPDGQTIAFSWRGDLWTVPAAGGQARRLTVHPGDDRMPQWSPDGKWIAFSGKREGNYDVFVISADGGGTRQLTYHSANDLVTGWSADGKTVLFTTGRDWDRGVLWSVPVAGGTERKVTRGQTATADVSADGKTLLVSSGSINGWWRKGYRGSNNWVIWSRAYDTMGGATRLSTFTGRNGWAAFGSDGKIYFLSDSTGPAELWRMNADGSGKEAVTHLRKDGAQFLSVARRAPIATFEMGPGIYTVALGQGGGGMPKEVAITAASDEQFTQIVRETLTSDASDFALSPDGREAAFVVRGDVFVTSTRGGAAVNLTNSAARDQAPVWSPDGKSLLFVSDREGNEDLWLVRSADSAEPRLTRTVRTAETRLTSDPASELRAVWSPDGKQIAFYRQGDPPSIWIVDAEGKHPRKFRDGYIQALAWSPDGKWIAYSESRQGEAGRFATDVFVAPAAGGDAVNVTMYPAQNRSPAWSPDGKRLAFISSRGTDPAQSGGESISEVYQIWLQRTDAEKTRDDWAAEDELAGGGGGRRGGRRDSSAVPAVTIDFEGITDRAERVTEGFQARSFAFSPDSRQYAVVANVVGQSDVWVVGRDGGNPTKISRGGQVSGDLAFDPEGRRIYYLTSRGTLGSATTGTTGEGGGGGIGFRATVTIDRAAEPVQMFEEAWRTLGANFYDPKMHGRDWKAVEAAYRPLAEAAYTKEALGDVILMMIGELNASHLNFSLPREEDAVSTGELGLVFDDAYRGAGLKVASVVPGGPTDMVGSTVKPAEYLLAVGDDAITATTNVYALLNGTAGRRIAITVGPTPDGKGARVVAVRPVSSGELGNLNYAAWVEQNRAKVHELSGGRVGYLHIRAMNPPSLEQFKRDLWGEEYANGAVIIDQRYNGGGNIHEQLWTELLRRAPIYFTNRAGDRRLSPPQWQKPTIVMQNQNSFSDAEIFPYGVKALGLAKTLGVPTGGGVIGTRNIQLIDGSTFRLPGSGVYATKDGRNLENWGIEPDIPVENPFEAEQLGHDRQLERAVQELLAALGAGN